MLSATFGIQSFYHFLHSAVPGPIHDFAFPGGLWIFQAIYVAASLAGIGLTYVLYRRAPGILDFVTSTSAGAMLHRLSLAGWGFDWVYQTLIVRPYVRLARLNRGDCVDVIYAAVAGVSYGTNRALSRTVNGNVRWYVAAIAFGAVAVAGLVLVL